MSRLYFLIIISSVLIGKARSSICSSVEKQGADLERKYNAVIAKSDQIEACGEARQAQLEYKKLKSMSGCQATKLEPPVRREPENKDILGMGLVSVAKDIESVERRENDIKKRMELNFQKLEKKLEDMQLREMKRKDKECSEKKKRRKREKKRKRKEKKERERKTKEKKTVVNPCEKEQKGLGVEDRKWIENVVKQETMKMEKKVDDLTKPKYVPNPIPMAQPPVLPTPVPIQQVAAPVAQMAPTQVRSTEQPKECIWNGLE